MFYCGEVRCTLRLSVSSRAVREVSVSCRSMRDMAAHVNSPEPSMWASTKRAGRPVLYWMYPMVPWQAITPRMYLIILMIFSRGERRL